MPWKKFFDKVVGLMLIMMLIVVVFAACFWLGRDVSDREWQGAIRRLFSYERNGDHWHNNHLPDKTPEDVARRIDEILNK